ncbi:MAG: cell division protein FtsL [bacterium]
MSPLKRRPNVLKHQFRWKFVPQVFWNAFQSPRVVALMCLLITSGCLGYLWQWSHYRQLSYEVQRLEAQRQQLSEELDLLVIESQFLTRPQRLEQIATRHLDLKTPDPEQFAYLEQLIHSE